MKKVNVLIFPSGAENSINIFDSLKYNIHFELYGATIKNDHSSYIFDNNHLSVGDYSIKSSNFIKNFNYLLEKFKIEFIIPTHDEIVTFLTKNATKINATIVASPYETCEIAFSKIKTFEKLKGKNYLPKIYRINDKISYPVFIKPDIGSGGKGTYLINSENELKLHCNNNNYLISEYLPGEEFTVDCFTNSNRTLLFCGARSRERITSGVSFHSATIPYDKEIEKIAQDLNNVFEFRGLWFFQLKKSKTGEYKLMEICTRAAGTMALYRQLGVNFAALSLFDFMGYDVSILINHNYIELDRYYKCCYKCNINYHKVYVDFDDTLIINDKVNTLLMQFLYQCVNDSKEIILLTRHDKNIYTSLKKYKISKNLFSKIIHIDFTKNKVDYVEGDSIYIDNYFADRKLVYDKLKIPVFDVDAVECLISYDRM